MTDHLLTGFILGDYEILDHIGRGGMGVVYRARQISLDRTVAIKVLPPEFCEDQEYIDRFLREARAAANLNHPHIIQVFDAGVSAGLYFFVMEFVDGKNLGQIMKEEGPFEEREALHAIHQAAEGLAFAHSMGMVHRDVKPENMMLTSTGIVKIGDLGLAKWKPNEFDVSLTAAGSTLGTPCYISPEQIRGWKDIDSRTDIYALGMTFYHLIVGSPAFASGTAAEIMAHHLSTKAPSLRLSNPKVSQATINLFGAMVEKKREKRIQEMSSVVDEIAEILGYEKGLTLKNNHRGLALSLEKRIENYLSRILQMGVWGVTFIFFAAFTFLIFLYISRSSVKTSKKSTVSHPVQSELKKPVLKSEESIPVKIVKEDSPKEVMTRESSSPDSIATISIPELLEFESEKMPVSLVDPKQQASPKSDSLRISKPMTELPQETPLSIGKNSKQTLSSESIHSNPTSKADDPPTVFQGHHAIQVIPITTATSDFEKVNNKPFKFMVGRRPTGSVSKALLRVEFTPDLNIARKILDSEIAVLELTLEKGRPIDGEFEVEVCKILKSWGIDLPKNPLESDSALKENFYFPLDQWMIYFEAIKKETNWKEASHKKMTKWSAEGASRRGFDYQQTSLTLADKSNLSTIKIDELTFNKTFRFNVLSDLEQWSNRMLAQNQFIPHDGWVIQVTPKGRGEAIFYSPYKDSGVPYNGPRLVLTPKHHSVDNDSVANTLSK